MDCCSGAHWVFRPVGATSGRWRVTGIRQSIWRPDNDSKSYKFQLLDSSSRPAVPTCVRAASYWKLKCVYESGATAQHNVAHRPITLHVVAQPLRDGEHPLAHRQTRKDVNREVCSRLHHAPGIAREADATAFAGIGHEVFVSTIVTPRPGKVLGKDAAFQIFAKGLADIRLWGVVVALAVELAGAGRPPRVFSSVPSSWAS